MTLLCLYKCYLQPEMIRYKIVPESDPQQLKLESVFSGTNVVFILLIFLSFAPFCHSRKPPVAFYLSSIFILCAVVACKCFVGLFFPSEQKSQSILGNVGAQL